jgi:hypothetical protein
MTTETPQPLKTLAEQAEEWLSGLPSNPTICAGAPFGEESLRFDFPYGHGKERFLRFDYPYGLCLTVRPSDEKEFLLQAAWQSTEPARNLRMTPDGQHQVETSHMGILGRLEQAARCQNPAALLPSDRRYELRESAREKLLEDWELNRWEKLVFAKSLLDDALPNR